MGTSRVCVECKPNVREYYTFFADSDDLHDFINIQDSSQNSTWAGKLHSSFESLLERTKNMPELWEILLLNISGSDLANCLRVCKTLRSIVKQCLRTNSKLRHKVDCAATSSAISKGVMSGKPKIPFSKMPKAVLALDGAWFDKGGTTVVRISSYGYLQVFRLPRNDNGQAICKLDEGTLQPTLDNRGDVLLGDSNGVYLLRASQITPDSPTVTTIQCDIKNSVEFQPWFEEPRCARYRLCQFKDPASPGHGQIVMWILDRNGMIDRPVVLYNYQMDLVNFFHMFYFLSLNRRHLSSNDEVIYIC